MKAVVLDHSEMKPSVWQRWLQSVSIAVDKLQLRVKYATEILDNFDCASCHWIMKTLSKEIWIYVTNCYFYTHPIRQWVHPVGLCILSMVIPC